MLVWPGFEPATSCSVDRCSPNWANQAAHVMRITTFALESWYGKSKLVRIFSSRGKSTVFCWWRGERLRIREIRIPTFPWYYLFFRFCLIQLKKYDFLGIGCIFNFDFGRLKGFLPWSGQYRSCTDRLDLVAHYTCWKASHFSALSLQN